MERADFAKFFAAVNGGHTPFMWQERLLDTILENGRWPDRIAAPTGAGKTSSIDIHVFALALTARGGPRLPRRLAMVVDRRVLVDDQYEHARSLSQVLAHNSTDIVAEVARELAALRWPAGIPQQTLQSPLVTGRMRGGSAPSRSWRDNPSACAVLCATPDMWGSRILFGGYGTSDESAPREAGLLAFDSVLLVDEAHLARQLLVTACRVARLAQAAEQPIIDVPALQVVEVSATPQSSDEDSAVGQISVGVDEGDLVEASLAARLSRPKPVTLMPVKGWPSAGQPARTAVAAAEAVTAMLSPVSADGLAQTVACFVNSVPTAMAVAGALRLRSVNDQPLRVVTVCGQMRPADMDRLNRRYPGIFSPAGNRNVDVIVSTQSLEVGVDLDLAGIVTELASGSALAQRAGRVNRRGKRDRSPVTVLVPADPITERSRSGPYSGAELDAALTWITERAASSDGLSPWIVREHPPPDAHRRRILYQRLEVADAWHWARTSDRLAAEPELDLWLADSLAAETSVGIAVRDAVPEDPAEAVEFVRDLPPASWEIFPVPYRVARSVVAEIAALGQAPVRVRGDDVAPLRPGGEDGTSAIRLRPGDVIVIDSSSAVFTTGADGVFSPPVVVAAAAPDEPDGLEPARRGTADDVLHVKANPGPGEVILRLECSADHERVAGLAAATARQILDQFAESYDERPERERRSYLAELLGKWPQDQLTGDVQPMVDAVVGLLRGPVKHSDVVLRKMGERDLRVVVSDRRRAVADEDLRQVFTGRDARSGPVLLDTHQEHVASRAGMLAERLGLPGDLTSALRLAGAHHDDGKADPRFQVTRLGASIGDQLLAKSSPGSTVQQVRERQAQAGLPSRWRHEQRSVIDCWAAVGEAPAVDPLLAARLVGTSHGHGRAGFPHTSAQLARPDEPEEWLQLAASIFDQGGWDELVEKTHFRYGVWGCAFLEAVLRAADCQVSGEGG